METKTEIESNASKPKRTTSEVGHTKNLTNFDNLISKILGYGATYNPSKASIKATALQALSASAKNSMAAINLAMPVYSNAVAAREVAFNPLNKLAARILYAIEATDTAPQVIDNVKSLVRKIQGKRITPKKTDEQKEVLKTKGVIVKEISSSHTSYDNRAENLDQLIKLLASNALYIPNEADLKLAALTAYCTDLKAKNSAVIAAETPLSNARIARNDVLYKAKIGLVDVASDVKSYIKSIYGPSSPQYKQVSKIPFKTIKS
ncbi:MAG: hypothetical protein WCK02_16925 [Bacteroidota bacterium]